MTENPPTCLFPVSQSPKRKVLTPHRKPSKKMLPPVDMEPEELARRVFGRCASYIPIAKSADSYYKEKPPSNKTVLDGGLQSSLSKEGIGG